MSKYATKDRKAKKYWKREPNNSARRNTKQTLGQLDVRPSKQRGQNFVVNDLVISSIVDFGDPKEDEFLVEIGPGLGALTKSLYPYGLRTVIEIEDAFAQELKKSMPDLNIVIADAREFDWKSIEKPATIFTNLPYSISSEIVLKFCEMNNGVIKRIVLMLQKEFAQRLAAPVGSKDYGILSVVCQKAAFTRLGPIVGAENFFPKPKIDSQVIELKFREKKNPNELSDDQFFRKVVRAAFAKRRKMILNSLLSVSLASEEKLVSALEVSGISPNCRAQELSYSDFERFSIALKSS